jgi:hypothetical protein
MSRLPTTADLRDKHGRSFKRALTVVRREHPRLPIQVVRVKDPALLRDLKANCLWQRCAVCGRKAQGSLVIDLHHLTCGGRKSDEECALLPLCRETVSGDDCHSEVSGAERLLLWARWKFDATTLDWVRLIVLLGHFPDEPLPCDPEFGWTLSEWKEMPAPSPRPLGN